MIAPTCNRCGDELMEPGALLFGPSVDDIRTKQRLCVQCWPIVNLLTAVLDDEFLAQVQDGRYSDALIGSILRARVKGSVNG